MSCFTTLWMFWKEKDFDSHATFTRSPVGRKVSEYLHDAHSAGLTVSEVYGCLVADVHYGGMRQMIMDMLTGHPDVHAKGSGGQWLATTGVHERLTELLTAVNHRVYASVTPGKIVELLRLGESTAEGQPADLGVTTAQLRDSFYGIIGFPRLEDEVALKRAIISGVKDGTFGYVGRGDRIERDRLREGTGYFVGRGQVIIERELRPDEIDLGAGFIVLPAGIEAEAPPKVGAALPVEVPAPTVPGEGEGVIYQVPGEAGAGPVPAQTRVRFRVTLNRQQIYASFNAFANLADKAGTIEVWVDAQSLEGFDPVWLRNAVIEPLEEADVEVEGEWRSSYESET